MSNRNKSSEGSKCSKGSNMAPKDSISACPTCGNDTSEAICSKCSNDVRLYTEMLKDAGVCYICGKSKAASGKFSCSSCINFIESKKKSKEPMEQTTSMRHYYKKINEGLCIKCRKAPSFAGKIRCKECQDKVNARNRERRLKKHLEG